MKTRRLFAALLVFALVLTNLSVVSAGPEPGTRPADFVPPRTGPSAAAAATNSLAPVVTETGRISLSVDGLGTNSAEGGTIQVEKAPRATVRRAFFAAASTPGAVALANGDVKIDGTDVAWISSIRSSMGSSNHWADVTAIVKPKIDAAPPGRIDFLITEVDSFSIDGEILAVIFDDPNQPANNTVSLLFGAQDVNGDAFAVRFAEPINKSNPNLALALSLGISFGYQPSGQYSVIDVNDRRLTTSAGGQDDGQNTDGALLTVGGLDDSPDNPADPFATDDAGPRADDELYDLKPFVNTGDTTATIRTSNPSNDANIFFGAFFLQAVSAIVGEGILLSPPSATNPVGTPHTVAATLQDDNGRPIAGREVTFTVTSGPHAGTTGKAATDAKGGATFTYTGTKAGVDTIVASFVDSTGATRTSNSVTKEWTGGTFRLNLSSTAGGSASANPPGPTYPANTPVSLTATANPGFTFTGWTVNGAAAGNANPLPITMDRDHTVVANFAAVPPSSFPLNLTTTAGGNIVASPAPSSPTAAGSSARITATASGTYPAGTRVTLTAKADVGFIFTGWTIGGSPVGAGNPLVLTMNSPYDVLASFAPGNENTPGWSSYTAQGGPLTEAPAAASFNGKVYVFARGSGNALYVKNSVGDGFTEWRGLGGVLTSAPSAAVLKGRLYVFARGTGDALYVRSSADGVNFTEWKSLGGMLTAAPAAASANNILFVFARGSDNALYLKRSTDGNTFGEWQSLGGVLLDAPAAAGFKGQVFVFARGSDSALYEKHSSNGGATFTNWRRLGGILLAAPAAATHLSASNVETLYLFAHGTNSGLWSRHTVNGSAFTDWVSLGGQLEGAPAAAGVKGRMYAFVRWSDNNLAERHTAR